MEMRLKWIVSPSYGEERAEKKIFPRQGLTNSIEVSTLVNALETAQEVAKRSEPRKNNSLKAIWQLTSSKKTNKLTELSVKKKQSNRNASLEHPGAGFNTMESLILAQDERWRYA